MKKFILFILIFVVFVGVVSAENAIIQPKQDIYMTTGVIKTIHDNMVTVVGEGNEKEITLIVSEKTYLFDGTAGATIDLAMLEKGMSVMTYYNPAMTKSIPPQSRAIAIITGNSPQTAKYIKVSKVEYLENGVRVLNSNFSQFVTIKNEVLPYPKQIQEGQKLLVWYSITTLSMPGQATALKAMLISQEKTDIVVHLMAGIIAVNNQEIQLDPNIPKLNDTMLLPLASISEALGYKVSWNEEKRVAELHKGNMIISAYIGNKNYGKARANIELDEAPRIINGRTYVPMEFFTKILNNTLNIVNWNV